MSEEPGGHHWVTNHQDQPLELHLPTRVVVLEAHATLVLTARELEAPQVQVLRRARVLEARPAGGDGRRENVTRGDIQRRDIAGGDIQCDGNARGETSETMPRNAPEAARRGKTKSSREEGG